MVSVISHRRINNGKLIKVRQHKRVYKLRLVEKEKLKDYAGMNHYAGKVMGYKPHIPKDEIWVNKDLPQKEKINTIKHEIKEAELMRKGNNYWESHLKALKIENGR